MRLGKYWREAYLTLMVAIALAIILAAVVFFSDLAGLEVMAAGVFVAVLGVGLYDEWDKRLLQEARVKTRR